MEIPCIKYTCIVRIELKKYEYKKTFDVKVDSAEPGWLMLETAVDEFIEGLREKEVQEIDLKDDKGNILTVDAFPNTHNDSRELMGLAYNHLFSLINSVSIVKRVEIK